MFRGGSGEKPSPPEDQRHNVKDLNADSSNPDDIDPDYKNPESVKPGSRWRHLACGQRKRSTIFGIWTFTLLAFYFLFANFVSNGQSPWLSVAGQQERWAYYTVLNDEFVKCAEALGKSIVNSTSPHDLVALVPLTMPPDSQQKLRDSGWIVKPIDFVVYPQRLAAIKQGSILLGESIESLGTKFTKLNLWKETQYDKIIFLDADVLVFKNIDHLFQLPEIAAVPAGRLRPRFNSGVMVIKPNEEKYNELSKAAFERLYDRKKTGDQSFLNYAYKDKWVHLADEYNWRTKVVDDMTPEDVLKNIFVFHFTGSWKPCGSNPEPDVEETGKSLVHAFEVYNKKFYDYYNLPPVKRGQ